jgi:hypothetical protein
MQYYQMSIKKIGLTGCSRGRQPASRLAAP